VKFQNDTEKTQKLNYGKIADSTVRPLEVRQKIKSELLKHLEQVIKE